MDRSGPLTICAAGRPGTGTTPVSIRAIPTPLPVNPAATGLVAPIAAATSVTLFPLPDAHWVADHGDEAIRAGATAIADAACEPGAANTPPIITAATNAARPRLWCISIECL